MINPEPIFSNGRRINRGSSSIIWMSCSEVKSCFRKLVFLKEGLFHENTSSAVFSPRRPINSDSEKGTLKKSRSIISTPSCKSSALTERQVLQRCQV
jgi:hypothetical protein